MTVHEGASRRRDASLLPWMHGRRDSGTHPGARPSTGEGAPDMLAATLAVQRALARFHPSFAFEERLAHRLREEAGGMPRASTGAPLFAADGATVAVVAVDVPGRVSRQVLMPFPRAASVRAASVRSAIERRNRGALILGGAIASGVSIAGMSLAGAAFIAWRRGRAPERWERLS